MARCNKVGHSSCAPFQRLTERFSYAARVLSPAHPAALALIDLLHICACGGAVLSRFLHVLCGGRSDAVGLGGGRVVPLEWRVGPLQHSSGRQGRSV